MLEFFKNIFKKLKNSINQERYIESYKELINIFRRVTPLELQDIDNIHTILARIVENTAILDQKMKILKSAIRNKSMVKTQYDQFIKSEFRKIAKRKMNFDKDVSYSIGGKIIYGDISSEEEKRYFSRENVENLNSMPFKPKICDFECQRNECKACIERRLRMEISKKLEIENQELINENIKKRRTSKDMVTELNAKLGVPVLFGRYVADDKFNIEDLSEDQRNEFMKWKAEQKKSAEIAKKILNINQLQDTYKPEHSILIEQPNLNRSFGRVAQNTPIYNQFNFNQPNLNLGGQSQIEELKDDQVLPEEISLGSSNKSPIQELSTGSIDNIFSKEPSSRLPMFTNNTISDNITPTENKPIFDNNVTIKKDISVDEKANTGEFISNSNFQNPFANKSATIQPNLASNEIGKNELKNPFSTINPLQNVQLKQPAFNISNPFSNINKLENPFNGLQNNDQPAFKITNPFSNINKPENTLPNINNPVSNITSQPSTIIKPENLHPNINNPFSNITGQPSIINKSENTPLNINNPLSNITSQPSIINNPFSNTGFIGINKSDNPSQRNTVEQPPFNFNNTFSNANSLQSSPQPANTFPIPSPAQNPIFGRPNSPNIPQMPNQLFNISPSASFEQPSNFSNKNIFQANPAEQQDNSGLFSGAEESPDDSFGRRKKAFRKR